MWKNLTPLGRLVVVTILAAVLMLGGYLVTLGASKGASKIQTPEPITAQTVTTPPQVAVKAAEPQRSPLPVPAVTTEEAKGETKPKPAQKSVDPWADLKIERKGN